MPYFKCPKCELALYGAAPPRPEEPCPRCGAELAVEEIEDGLREAPQMLRDRRFNGGAPPEVLIRLQERIAARIGYGYTMAEVERELIEPSPANDAQRSALRLFAEKRLKSRSSS